MIYNIEIIEIKDIINDKKSYKFIKKMLAIGLGLVYNVTVVTLIALKREVATGFQ